MTGRLVAVLYVGMQYAQYVCTEEMYVYFKMQMFYSLLLNANQMSDRHTVLISEYHGDGTGRTYSPMLWMVGGGWDTRSECEHIRTCTSKGYCISKCQWVYSGHSERSNGCLMQQRHQRNKIWKYAKICKICKIILLHIYVHICNMQKFYFRCAYMICNMQFSFRIWPTVLHTRDGTEKIRKRK